MNDIRMLVNGQLVQAANGATFVRRNPVSQAVATTAPAATAHDALAAVEAAAAALPAWAALGPSARRALLTRAAHEIEARADTFADAMALETGARHCRAPGVWQHRSFKVLRAVRRHPRFDCRGDSRCGCACVRGEFCQQRTGGCSRGSRGHGGAPGSVFVNTPPKHQKVL